MKSKANALQPIQNSISVIQTSLIVPEESLRTIWILMANSYSELVKNLLEYVNSHPNFDTWLDNSSLPDDVLQEFVRACQNISLYQELPGRFRTSAITLVKNMYASWFTVRKQKLNSLKGKKRFLAILKSDEELQNDSGLDLYTLATKAEELLNEVRRKLEKEWEKDGTKPLDEEGIYWKITNALYEIYEKTTSNEKRCITCYLIKNGNKIPESPETIEDYQLRRKTKEIEIQRLEEQLQGSVPKARLLDDRQWLQALDEALQPITEIEDFKKLQVKLLRGFYQLPYPIFYGSNIDIYWWVDDKNRIFVTFNGLKSKEIFFEIACDKRQLPYFQRFLADFQRYSQKDGTMPPGLMLLRSAHLVWKPGTGKGEPWLDNHLHLHCAIDNRLRSLSQTEITKVRAEKIAATQKRIDSLAAKSLEKPLTENQQQKSKALEASLERLNNFDIARLASPADEGYRGNPSIVLGVAIGLINPVTIAIINVETKTALTYRCTKQLLDRSRKAPNAKNPNDPKSTHRTFKEINDYDLFLRYQNLKHHNKHERHKAQIKFADSRFGEANLGLYIARLLAKAVVTVARDYQVATIILPDMTNIREIIEADIRARAELKYPGNKIAQKHYAFEFRSSVNRWNYKQLGDCITNTAIKAGIEVVSQKQLAKGTGLEKAGRLALAFGEKKQSHQQIEARQPIKRDAD